MKYKSCIAVLAIAFVVAGAAAASTTPSYIETTGHFYSDYELLNVHFLVGANSACVKDQYGFYGNPNCQDVDSNDATYDVQVYQTYPHWRFVHSERDYGISGHDTVELFWNIDLLVPYCGQTAFQRRFKAVVRLFSPVTDAIVARTTQTFGVNCRPA